MTIPGFRPRPARAPDVRCRFYVRELPPGVSYHKPGGQWRYESMWLPGWHGDGCLHTPYPPVKGDVIYLADQPNADGRPRRIGHFRVLDRGWLHSGYGSVDWPHGQSEATSGPELMVVVEQDPDGGLFVNEAELTDAEREEMEA